MLCLSDFVNGAVVWELSVNGRVRPFELRHVERVPGFWVWEAWSCDGVRHYSFPMVRRIFAKQSLALIAARTMLRTRICELEGLRDGYATVLVQLGCTAVD